MKNLLTEKAQVYFERGKKLQNQGNFAESIQNYEQAIKIQPDYPQPLSKLAEIYESQKDWSKAIEYYQLMVSLEPEKYAHYLKLARTLQRRNHRLRQVASTKQDESIIYAMNQKAIAAYQKAIALQHKQPVWVYIALGDSLYHNGQVEQALAAYQKATEVKPDNSEAYTKLAKAMMTINQTNNAIAGYQKAFTLQPKQPVWVYIALGDSLYHNGQLEEALTIYHNALEIEPESVSVLNSLTKIYKQLYLKSNREKLSQNKNLQEIVEIYHKAIKLNPNKAENYFGMGLIFLAQEKWEEAIESFIETLKRKPNWNQVYTSLAYALNQQGNEDQSNIRLCYEKYIIPRAIIKKICDFEKQDLITSLRTASNLDYKEIEEVEPSITQKTEKTFVVTLTKGRAWRNLVNNCIPNDAVISSNNKLVKEVSEGANSPLIICANNFTQPHKFDETVAYLQGIGINNYYHWMLQVIPQIILLRRVGINLETIQKFAFFRLPTHLPFQKETLSLLGIPRSKIIETFRHPLIQAKRLIVTSPIKVSPPRKLACDLVRNEFLDKQLPESKDKSNFLYLSRQNASYRKIVNENELIALLNNLGFETFCLESMSFLEQVNLFSKAKVIISPHGAALTNLIFCNPGVKVIEIFSPTYYILCYKHICNYYNLKHYSFIAEGLENPDAKKDYDKHINVNLNSLLDLMKLIDII